ncbi:MAG: thymidine phosphorylase [Deltaproteobacteria bacterium]|nr:thymidine phosphorylase [Deltaproteobacteria bacterium]
MLEINPASIIQTKRDGKENSEAQIQWMIQSFIKGEVADYQITAWLMAIYFQGMTASETLALTKAMIQSGERYDLNQISGVKIDKHSTGGVGDKVSLILAPLAAACGLKVPMMSGRGLGFTGGTLDKLECISRFNVGLTYDLLMQVLHKVGFAMIGQSENIVPADKKLYALRDVTGTVECIPLIAASILSKKVAEGSDGLVFDVKVGSGAFMKTKEKAKTLAKTLIRLGKNLEINCRALLTQMEQPLGYAVGHSLELIECIEILKNEDHSKILGTLVTSGSGDLKELTIQLTAHMLELGKISRNLKEARQLAYKKLADGSAWKKFLAMVQEQGGSTDQVLNPKTLPLTQNTCVWKAKKAGFLSQMHTEVIGKILIELGGGRKKVTDTIDYRIGFIFHKKLGSRVGQDEPLTTVFLPDAINPQILDDLESYFHSALEITPQRKTSSKLILEVI